MDVCVGVMAHNEQAGIRRCLNSLLRQSLKPARIIVVSSSTDRTNDIVQELAGQSKRITLIAERQRTGKVAAINRFLKHAKSELVALVSADTVPQQDALAAMAATFSDQVGIVGARPEPRPAKGLMAGVVRLQWELHHRIALQRPKFGEMVMFRNVVRKLPQSAADEEQIAALLQKQGYRGAYAPDAVVRNTGPTTIRDFIRQRRRIHCGHIALSKAGYQAPSMSAARIVRALREVDVQLTTLAAAGLLEALGRALGRIDSVVGRRHHVWAMARSTKR